MVNLNLENKTILVTGADGFIGSHLVEALVPQCRQVRALTLYNSFGGYGWLDQLTPDFLKSIDIQVGDVRDRSIVKTAMQDCDLVFHLAALIAIPYSYDAPGSYIETNVGGTLNVLLEARDQEIDRLVHTSTSEVYGSAKFVPITEEHPLQPQSPYAASKLAADHLAQSFHLSFETPIATIRPFNTYGPRQSARAVIPTVITQIGSGKREISLGALDPTRDFNYISDTVSGFISVAQSDAAVGEVTNIGGSNEISIRDLVDLIGEVMGVNVEVKLDKNRLRPENSEVDRLYACNEKALKLTGWSPKYQDLNGLRSGLRKTADWFLEPANLGNYKTNIYNV